VNSNDGGVGRTLALWDYRRRVTDLYGRVRELEPSVAHALWVATRDDLFRSHLQSPLPDAVRPSFGGLAYWRYDPALRAVATVEPASGAEIALGHSDGGTTSGQLFGRARFRLGCADVSLDLYWLDGYAGGVFMPFRDESNGTSTYGGGRYLLDTVKGADLGHDGERLIVDFNFAYHPSCAHDPRWSCPLAPPGNRLSIPILGGERLG
jgi:hypothetical protein